MGAQRRKNTAEPKAAFGGPVGGKAAAGEPVTGKPAATSHPRALFRLTCFICLPYAAYVSYLWVHLESGWLRPPVAHGEPRQVLIVGSQSSGTVQTTAALTKLGFEVAHEASDASTIFCRDGTISWFHGIRFLPGSASEDSLNLVCARSLRNMGFHPAAFRRSSRCSYRAQWDACWARECREAISESWGCAVTEGRACETPFERSLLQARHPLRTMESLVVKFCRSEASPPEPSLLIFAHGLWPEHAWNAKSCMATVGWYVTLYYEAMMSAVDAGRIDAVYQAESTGVCDLARLAGFANASYEPTRQVLSEACASPGGGPGLDDGAVRNTRNRGLVRLSRANLTEADPALEGRVEALARRMGYAL